MICLTETQILWRPQTEINTELQEFQIIHNANVDRLQRLAFCLKDHIGIISYEKLVGASYITFSKTTYFDYHIKLLLLYKKHALNETMFYNWLAEFGNSHNIDIILGDFNIELFWGKIKGYYMFCPTMSRLFQIQHIYMDLCWIMFIY